MKCVRCDRELTRREYAQPWSVLGERCWPPQACDSCCKASPTPPGNAAALERLARGITDPDEAERVRAATGALAELGKAGKP